MITTKPRQPRIQRNLSPTPRQLQSGSTPTGETMKHQRSFALLDTLVLTFLLASILLFCSPPAAASTDYAGPTKANEWAYYCRPGEKSKTAKAICIGYYTGVLDTLLDVPVLCYNQTVDFADGLLTNYEYIIADDSNASKPAAQVIANSLLRTQTIIVCQET